MKFTLGPVSSCLFAIAAGRPHPTKRDATTLRDSYDFIIAGGGIVGLTVADRLSEAFPNKTVLVVEYGENNYAPGSFDPPSTTFGNPKGAINATRPSSATVFGVNHLPIKDVDYRIGTISVGKAVGGSGAINGQFFDRGSRFDYDAWTAAAAGSSEFEASGQKWDWNGMLPFFKKSATFTPPAAAAVEKWGYTWDSSAWDNTTPIHAMLPPFQWGDHLIARKAWKELGIPEQRECALGDKDGICWCPTAQHPVTTRRSHAAIAHYDQVRRNNYDLLPLHQVIRVIYGSGPSSGPPMVEVRSVNDTKLRPFNISAKAEVILAAGAIHTPTILQRSGIGQRSFLDGINIKTVVDLPGVGSNYQDHWGPDISWAYKDPEKFSRDFWPLPSQMSQNATFYNDAIAGFDEIPARGPYTLAQTNAALFLSLPNMTTAHTAITDRIRSIAASSAAAHLPADLATESTIVAGYQAQLNALASLMDNLRAPSVEVTFGTGTMLKLISLHPLSRGTVRLNPAAPLDVPILDTRLASNPVDMDVHVAHLRWFRSNFLQTNVMRGLGAVATVPPDSLDNGDDEALKKYIRETASITFAHPCCTAPMMPKEKGGVVSADLKVYGASGLRVADMSVIPMLVSGHLSATAYAFGEKAASVIIKEWSAK